MILKPCSCITTEDKCEICRWTANHIHQPHAFHCRRCGGSGYPEFKYGTGVIPEEERTW